MSEGTVQQQIELAEDLIRFLNTTIENLNLIQQGYKNKLGTLRAEGMLKEPLDRLENLCFADTVKRINTTIRAISERDVPSVKNYIKQYLEPMLEK